MKLLIPVLFLVTSSSSRRPSFTPLGERGVPSGQVDSPQYRIQHLKELTRRLPNPRQRFQYPNANAGSRQPPTFTILSQRGQYVPPQAPAPAPAQSPIPAPTPVQTQAQPGPVPAPAPPSGRGGVPVTPTRTRSGPSPVRQTPHVARLAPTVYAGRLGIDFLSVHAHSTKGRQSQSAPRMSVGNTQHYNQGTSLPSTHTRSGASLAVIHPPTRTKSGTLPTTQQPVAPPGGKRSPARKHALVEPADKPPPVKKYLALLAPTRTRSNAPPPTQSQMNKFTGNQSPLAAPPLQAIQSTPLVAAGSQILVTNPTPVKQLPPTRLHSGPGIPTTKAAPYVPATHPDPSAAVGNSLPAPTQRIENFLAQSKTQIIPPPRRRKPGPAARPAPAPPVESPHKTTATSPQASALPPTKLRSGPTAPLASALPQTKLRSGPTASLASALPPTKLRSGPTAPLASALPPTKLRSGSPPPRGTPPAVRRAHEIPGYTRLFVGAGNKPHSRQSPVVRGPPPPSFRKTSPPRKRAKSSLALPIRPPTRTKSLGNFAGPVSAFAPTAPPTIPPPPTMYVPYDQPEVKNEEEEEES